MSGLICSALWLGFGFVSYFGQCVERVTRAKAYQGLHDWACTLSLSCPLPQPWMHAAWMRKSVVALFIPDVSSWPSDWDMSGWHQSKRQESCGWNQPELLTCKLMSQKDAGHFKPQNFGVVCNASLLQQQIAYNLRITTQLSWVCAQKFLRVTRCMISFYIRILLLRFSCLLGHACLDELLLTSQALSFFFLIYVHTVIFMYLFFVCGSLLLRECFL